MRRFLAIVLLVLANAPSVEAATAPSGANLAKGASYTYTPAALYNLTRDDGDATQLTDGKLAPNTMWTSREAVGWRDAPMVEIEIDLGEVRAIGQVCLRSARRAEAGVSFPRRVDVFLSQERKRYAWAGNLIAGQDAGEGPYLATRFCSGAIQRDSRYVRLLVATRGPFFFSDEIEVSPADAKLARGSEANRVFPLGQDQLKTFSLEHEVISKLADQVVRRSGSAAAASAPAAGLRKAIGSLADTSGALGLEQVAAAHADVRRAVRQERVASGRPLDVRLADPWRLATPLDAVFQAAATGEIDVPQGGYAAIALGIEHADENPVRVRVSAEIASGAKDALQLKPLEVAMVTRADGVRFGDALVPLRNSAFEVGVGESRQVWVEVIAGAGASGVYTVRVRCDALVGGKEISRSLEIPVRVWGSAMSTSAPSTSVWGYLDSPPIRSLPKAAAADMLAHGANTAVLPAGNLPWPRSGASAADSPIGDYRRFDEVMDNLKGHRRYVFFLAFNTDSINRSFGKKHEFLSDSWKALFTAWIKEWTTRLRKSGLGYDAFAIQPVDEPHKGRDHDTLVAVARLIKSVDPQIAVYTTLHQPDVLSDALIDTVNIFQLNGKALDPAIIARLKARGKQTWGYWTTGGGKAGDPATFYRAQGWHAFTLALSGLGFWAYADVGRAGTAWDDTDGIRPDFAVVYEGDGAILSSKRWEAWREGVQDYRILTKAYQGARSPKEQDEIRQLTREGLAALGKSEQLAVVRRKVLERASLRAQ